MSSQTTQLSLFQIYGLVFFSSFITANKCAIPRHHTTAYFVRLLNSPLLLSQRYNSGSYVPRWWQPYSWGICMYESRVSTTWRWGKSPSISGWNLPPCPEFRQYIKLRVINDGASGGTHPDNYFFTPSLLPGGPSQGPSGHMRMCHYLRHTCREYCCSPSSIGPVWEALPLSPKPYSVSAFHGFSLPPCLPSGKTYWPCMAQLVWMIVSFCTFKVKCLFLSLSK